MGFQVEFEEFIGFIEIGLAKMSAALFAARLTICVRYTDKKCFPSGGLWLIFGG